MPEDNACPHCGETLKLIPIFWGYPTEAGFEEAELGELVLGGCAVSDVDPTFACAACQEPLPLSSLMADRPDFRLMD